MSMSLNSCHWLITLGRDDKVRCIKVFWFGSLKKNHFHWFQTRVEVRFFTFREWLRKKSCSFLAEVSREHCKSHYFSALRRGYFPSSLAVYLARSIMPSSVALDIIFIRWSVYLMSMLQGNRETHGSFSEFTEAVALEPVFFL